MALPIFLPFQLQVKVKYLRFVCFTIMTAALNIPQRKDIIPTPPQ